MVELIQRIEDPELFFGLVAPIGTNVEPCISELSSCLSAKGYTPVVLRVTDVFAKVAPHLKFPIELREFPYDERYRTYISYGDLLRKHFDDDAVLAAVTISSIARTRSEAISRSTPDHPQRTAYIIRQFKRKEEVDLMRSVYGRLFFQISIYSKRSARVDNIARKIAASHNSADGNRYRDVAEALVRTDEHEADDRHGQRVSEVFHEADLIVTSDLNDHSTEKQLSRFVDLVFGSNSISPSKMEYGMYAAKSASLRTLDLSRQVGASLFSGDGEIISLGTNEVPKGGGGTYWSDGEFDARDFKRNEDSNEKRKRELLSELIGILLPEANAAEILSDETLGASQFMDALEYGRIIHAEMSAICDAARLGRSLRGSTMYVTTFPCHMCAKHIVASGVGEVIYLEPYPKSLASELHGDSVEIEGQSRGVGCCRFRRHRVGCFDGTGGGSWRGGSLHASSSLRQSG